MTKYKKVYTTVWLDRKFRQLSPIPPCGQGLWLYLLTCPESGAVPGLFRAGEAALAEALGWPLIDFRKAFQEAFREGMVKADWEARVVWLTNAVKYNPPESPNVIKAWRKAADDVPDCELKYQAIQGLKCYVEGLTEGFVKAFREAFGKDYAKPVAVTVAVTVAEEEEKNPEKSSAAKPPPRVVSPAVLDLWAHLKRSILKWKPDHAIKNRALAKASEIEGDKMLRIDRRKPGQVKELITWLFTDYEASPKYDWRPNIESLSNLRKHYDRLDSEMRKPAFNTDRRAPPGTPITTDPEFLALLKEMDES